MNKKRLKKILWNRTTFQETFVFFSLNDSSLKAMSNPQLRLRSGFFPPCPTITPFVGQVIFQILLSTHPVGFSFLTLHKCQTHFSNWIIYIVVYVYIVPHLSLSFKYDPENPSRTLRCFITMIFQNVGGLYYLFHL